MSTDPRYNILVIDDDAQVLDLLWFSLVDLGFGVETAASGPEGLEAYRSGEFDLVLTDVRMPEMDGIQHANPVQSDIRW